MGWKKYLLLHSMILLIASATAIAADFLSGSASSGAILALGVLFGLQGWTMVTFKQQEERIDRLEKQMRDLKNDDPGFPIESDILKRNRADPHFTE